MDKDDYFHIVSDDRWTWEEAYKKWFWLRFSLLLIALGLSIAMAYIYFVQLPKYQALAEKYQSGTYAVVHQAPSGGTPTVTTPAHIIDTSNWKTYTSTKYGFSFKYPAESASSSILVVSAKNVTELDIPAAEASLVYAASVDDIYNYKNILSPLTSDQSASAIQSLVTINGKSVPEMEVGSDVRVLFKHNNEFYVFSYSTASASAGSLSREMLGTFTFSTPLSDGIKN